MFLEKDDMNTVSETHVLNYLTEDENKFDTIVNESIAVMTGFLSHQFDCETIFNQAGEDRNLSILKYLKAIVIYEIYSSMSRDEPNTVVLTRYEDAMRWLEKVNTGEFKADLPLKPTEDQSQINYLKTGSKPSYRSTF